MNVDGEKKDEGEKKIEYEDVQLTSCIDGLLGAEALEYQCPSCAKDVVAIKLVNDILRLSDDLNADQLHQANQVRVVPRSPRRPCQEIPTG